MWYVSFKNQTFIDHEAIKIMHLLVSVRPLECLSALLRLNRLTFTLIFAIRSRLKVKVKCITVCCVLPCFAVEVKGQGRV